MALRRLRLSLKLTQHKVSIVSGLNEDTLRRIENGKVIPKFETLEILSQIYKYDLLVLLRKYRSDSELYLLYNELDKITLTKDTNLIQKLIKKIDNLEKYPNNNQLINKVELNLLKGYLLIVKTYLMQTSINTHQIIAELCQLLTLTTDDFNLHKYTQFQYSPIELRILIFIGLLFDKNKESLRSTELFQFCLERLEKEVNDSYEHFQLRIKLLFNLSYNAHKQFDDRLAFNYAETAIELSRKRQSSYAMGYLLFRKGIAQYKLNDDEHIDSLRASITMLELYNDIETVQCFKESALKNYNIKL